MQSTAPVKLIAVTPRVDTSNNVGERRDALDQRWWAFLAMLGNALPVVLPTEPALAKELLASLPISGILLSGGNSLAELAGDAPERDNLDRLCIEWAITNKAPLLGVCRGMQSIQAYYGIPLERVEDHVCARQQISHRGKPLWVNSYHNWGAKESLPPMQAYAYAQDGVVKAIEHEQYPLKGIMWHPEREDTFSTTDIAFFREFYQL